MIISQIFQGITESSDVLYLGSLELRQLLLWGQTLLHGRSHPVVIESDVVVVFLAISTSTSRSYSISLIEWCALFHVAGWWEYYRVSSSSGSGL